MTVKLAATLVAAVTIATAATIPDGEPVDPVQPIEMKFRQQADQEATKFLRAARDAYALVGYLESIKPVVRVPAPSPTSTPTRGTGAGPAPNRQAAPSRASEGATGACGGDLPPCSVMQRESGGDIRAQNPTSSASGKWQFIDSTWGNYQGYPTAADAPEAVQDQRAREVWAGGAGCSNWSETGAC